jgi:hypothetical protein
MFMFAAVVVQIGLAGYGAFNAAGKYEEAGVLVDEDTFNHGFEPHIAWGYLIWLFGIVFLLIGIAAGVGKWRLGRHGVLFLLLTLQVVLAWGGFGNPFPTGFLHPVNALVILGLTGWIVWDEWQLWRARRAGAATPVEPGAA